MNEIEAWKATGRRALRIARQRLPARQRTLGTVLGLGALVGTALLMPQHPPALRRAPLFGPAMMRSHLGARELGPAGRHFEREGGRRFEWGPGRPEPRREPAPPPEAPAAPVPPAPPAPPVQPAAPAPPAPPAPPLAG
jgi:hypothetical protein